MPFIAEIMTIVTRFERAKRKKLIGLRAFQEPRRDVQLGQVLPEGSSAPNMYVIRVLFSQTRHNHFTLATSILDKMAVYKVNRSLNARNHPILVHGRRLKVRWNGGVCSKTILNTMATRLACLAQRRVVGKGRGSHR